MTEWSALARRSMDEARRIEKMRKLPAEAYGYPPDYVWEQDEFQPYPVPRPGTGSVLVFSTEPAWLQGLGPANRMEIPAFMQRRTWSAGWYGDIDEDIDDDAAPEGSVRMAPILNCPSPLTHRLGVLEWAARQPAARVVTRIGGGADEIPMELTAVNRAPDPGTGYLRIMLDPNRPIWYAVWCDIYTGLAEFADDDLRAVIEWAQAQPAEDKLIVGDALDDLIDLAEFLQHPDRYLQAL
jgi:hypothetical protein